MAIAERLRQRIETESILMPAGHPLQITVSIGMVTCPGGAGQSLADLLKLADLAVYKAKTPAVTGLPHRNRLRRLPHGR